MGPTTSPAPKILTLVALAATVLVPLAVLFVLARSLEDNRATVVANPGAYLPVALVIGLFATLGILGTILALRSRRAAPTAEAPPRQAALVAAARAITCGTCGRQIRCRVEHAGRKIRCPGCGNVIAVPKTIGLTEICRENGK